MERLLAHEGWEEFLYLLYERFVFKAEFTTRDFKADIDAVRGCQARLSVTDWIYYSLPDHLKNLSRHAKDYAKVEENKSS